METLTIKIPKGFMYDGTDEASGVIKFKEKPKDVLERFKTIDDVLADHGYTPVQYIKQCEGLEQDEVSYRLMKLIAKSFNEGWTPNWDNSNEGKYYPWFYMGGSSGFRFNDYDHWYSISDVGSRLCFKSSKLAEYAGKQFTDVYKQFMTI